MKIKNVIFDLGGVFIPLDINATSEAFKKLGAKDFDHMYSFFQQEKFFDLFDKGKISAYEFRTELRKFLFKNITDEQIDEAWNAMLGVIPKYKIDFLRTVNQSFNTILLSNTNSIHVQRFLSVHDDVYGEGEFQKWFQKIYFSNNTGMRKPDVEIFDFVVEDSRLDISKTIFIDDSLHHVVGAQKAGLQAYHLNTATHSIEKLFEEILTQIVD